MKNSNNNKGITLVALIITIIVLLILAVVSINAVQNGGIIGYAKNAQQEYKKAVKDENLLMSNSTDYLAYYTGIEKGTIKTAKDITAEDYGKVVAYTPAIDEEEKTAGNKAVENWKIFYADENNIYLIADDYIKSDNCPMSKKNTALNKGDTDYKVYFTNILEDYKGSTDITDTRLQKLNNEYFFNREDKSTNASAYNNMKVVAYMMDTNVWNTYKDKAGKADYAIGGPTIEMLMKSYSKTHNVNYRAKATNIKGYQISIDGGVNWDNFYFEILSTTDNLYVINNQDKASGMWGASSISYDSAAVMRVAYNGGVGNCGYANKHRWNSSTCLFEF